MEGWRAGGRKREEERFREPEAAAVKCPVPGPNDNQGTPHVLEAGDSSEGSRRSSLQYPASPL